MNLSPLEKGLLLGRRKRFFADVEQNGAITVAHCPNTGSMRSLLLQGTQAFISRSDNPLRKLSHTLEILQLPDGTLACVNTHRANRQVEEALTKGWIQEFPLGCQIESEVAFGKGTRFDFRITKPDGTVHWLEVKNVTLLDDKETCCALFPDAVTERGAKHLRELTSIAESGGNACIFFLVNRSDALSFKTAEHIDPTYTKELGIAISAGVMVLVYKSRFHLGSDFCEIILDQPLPLVE